MTTRTKKCNHCEGTGQCNQGQTKGMIINVAHSCSYCVKKSTVKPDDLFPHVPCGYCSEKKEEKKPETKQNQQTSNGGKKYVKK